ncbi:hypothetical protein EB796_013499 [Bugula neritina]|uniref:ENOPH1 n=1 Tax=Bugula neritina TaxID=10212 RepID=A0A7J7JQE6_BUGNE|nr:hypothetical protein EB796_013499 [Bugula neritina]
MCRKNLTCPTVAVPKDISLILLDIEGTTTSISFVKDELFPYILKHVRHFLEEHWNDKETQAAISGLREQVKEDLNKDELKGIIPILSETHPKEQIIDSVVKNVEWQMGLDRKTTSLKQLQGHMWVDAYKKKEVRGHLYEDVTQCFRQWKDEGKQLCIYSSGSVAAQKLLFTYSVDGDITEYITDYFDTKIGGKREAASYTSICDHLKRQQQLKSWITVYDSKRPGNAVLTIAQMKQFATINSFEEIMFDEVASKKKKI